MSTAAPRGGRRDGAGRPTIDPDGRPSVRVSARLGIDDAALYRSLGGARWLREQLRLARFSRRPAGPSR